MATSSVQIANMALTGVGATRITALDQACEEARHVNAVYDPMLEEVQAAHPWNFTVTREELALLAEAPEFGWSYAFQLPTGCLRVLGTDLDENGYPWVIENGKLLTDQTTVKIKYIKKITDTTQFSPAFVNAFAARLEAELAFPLSQNPDLGKMKYTAYLEKLRIAKGIDSQEGRGLETMQGDAWLDSRNSGQI